MITQSARRPLVGSWKAILRRSRQQRMLSRRSMATEAAPTSSSEKQIRNVIPSAVKGNFKPSRFGTFLSTNPSRPVRTAFAVYPPPPSIRATNPSALSAFNAQQVRRLDRTGARSRLFSKANPDSARVGDVLLVTTSRGEPFAGVLLSIRRAGPDTAVLLRNRLTGVGVEMWYKIYSPTVQGMEVVWRRPKRARRARLTYMRQPRHDMGNVDHLVAQWRRTRNVFSSRKSSVTVGGGGKGVGGKVKGKK